MTSTTITDKINLTDNKFIIPLLIAISILLGVALLYSPGRSLFIYILAMAVAVIFIEPFIGAMIYLILLYVRPFELYPVPIPVMKYLALLILSVWLLKVIIHRQRSFVKAPQNLLMIAFLAILMISQKTYIQGVVDTFSEFSKIVIIYFLLINLVIDERRLKVTIWILILCTTYLAIQGILLSEGIAMGDINVVGSVVGENRVQSTGIFGDPNDMAMSLVIGIPFIFYLFFVERLILKKILLVVFGVLILYCILLTGSRGGMLGLVAVIFLLLRGKIGTFAGMVLAIICIVGLLVIAPSSTTGRYKDVTSRDSTAFSRIELWYYGWEMFKSSPIIGIGMGNYPEYAKGYVAHNSFVNVAAETGIIGLMIWIGLFYFAFKGLATIDKRADIISNSDRNHYATVKDPWKEKATRISLIGFIVCVFSLSRQYEYIPYVLMALTVSISHVSDSQKMRISLKDAVKIAGIAFVFIVWWFITVRIFL